MRQLGLFETTEEAIARSYDASPELWRKEARETVIEVATQLEEFIADDIWETGLAYPREPRALGGVLKQLAIPAPGQDGPTITATDRVRKSRRKQNHSRMLTLWRSNIFGT